MARGGKYKKQCPSSRVLRVEDLPKEILDQLGLDEEKAKSKYHNRKTIVDGIFFDSAREAKRWGELKLMQEAGEISDLQRQVKYPIVINGIKVCSYFADFTYTRSGAEITEDVKGIKTSIYRLKKKLIRAVYSIEIDEV